MNIMFRCYRQLEHSDCGLTCIRMIARHYGKIIPIQYLRGITDYNRLGMSINDITGCCEKIGLNSIALNLTEENLNNMPLPAIIYWQQRHFVVLYRIDERRKRFYVADPAQGKISYKFEEFVNYWKPKEKERGIVVLSEPTDKFYEMSYEKYNVLSNFVAYIWKYLNSYKKRFFTVFLFMLFLMIADFSVPILLQKTVDDGIVLRDMGIVIGLLLTQFAISLGEMVSTSIMNVSLTKISIGVNIDMVTEFLAKLSKFPISFFDKKVSSDFVQKINDYTRIKDFMLSSPGTIFTMVLSFIVFSGLLFHYSSLIFIVFIVFSMLEVLWDSSFLSRKKSIDYAQFSAVSENHNHAYELTNGMADLKINNAEDAKISTWTKTQNLINKIALKSTWLNLTQTNGHAVISRIKELSVTGISAYMVINGSMTFGVMLTLGYITGRLIRPFDSLSEMFDSSQNAILSYQRVDDILNDNSETRGICKYEGGNVCMNQVWFKYPGSGSPYVLKNITFNINEGDMIALVGESGCGKSTLIKLLLGFYIPDSGEILFGDKTIKELDNCNWLSNCGVVMQETKIFSGSILENIALSDTTPDLEKSNKVLEIVGLTDFINRLPMKLHTKLGVAGIELSGGQKQRLMIARALYKNPKFLFLDEATSSLDANNEKRIVDNILKYKSRKTIIIAAHRLSTIRNADRILFLKDGEIAEFGSHEDLIKKRGNYWNLVKNQLREPRIDTEMEALQIQA